MTATPFTSYSGNHEDVLLHRLFARDDGFFVDVGAGHPVLGSITKALSDRGWTGIDIAPRPEVPPLRTLLADAPRIDLLRIGVPGAEAVLASNDWDRFRPLLVMVAADVSAPGLLAGHGYRHVHFDGLTDYYAEAGFDVPAGAFRPPVNGRDFVPYREILLMEERDAARHRAEADAGLMGERIRALEVDLDRANREIVALRRQLAEKIAAGYTIPASRPADQLAREIAALYASTSWRITRPLRALARPRRTLNILLGRVAR